MSLKPRYLILSLTTTALLALGLIVGIGCWRQSPSSHQPMQVVVDTMLLREGDLLLRMGDGMESRVVAQLSGVEYSHIALAHRGPTGWMVVHAVPGEMEEGQQYEYLKAEPLDRYYAVDRATSGAIVRVDCSDACARGAVDFALDKVNRQFQFDHKYSLSDSTKYYCTELIYRAYLSQGIDFFTAFTESAATPLAKDPWLYPSEFIQHEKTLWCKVLDKRPAKD